MFPSSLSFLFLFYGLFSFFVFPFLGNAKQSLNCPCEKILERGKCDNPDCITVCNLQHVFNEAGEFIAEKCLEKGTKEISFDIKGENVSELEDVIDDIKDIVEDNDEILQKTCPGCLSKGETKAKLVPNPDEEGCNKYIYTNEYKGWRNTKQECDEDQKSGQICESNEEKDDKYEACCAKEYMFNEEGKLKIYSHTANTKEELEIGQTCGEEEANEIMDRIGSYVEGIMGGNSKKFSKKIYEKCPDGCSFYVMYLAPIDRTTCSGKLDLQVACTHKADRSGFPISLPVYDIEVDYKEEVKCQ